MTENKRLRERNKLLDDECRELTVLLKEQEKALEHALQVFRAQAVGGFRLLTT